MKKNKFPLVCISVMILTLAFTACDNDSGVATYTVSFVTNGGSALAQGSNITSIDIEPRTTRAGYTFDGWFTNSGLTGSRVTFPYTVTADTTLYAKWVLITYTVDFVTNDGSDVMQMNNITSIVAEPVTTREDYTFDGWFTNSGLTGSRVTFPYTVTADTTLYAKWVLITYTVDFVTNDGTTVTQRSNITSIDTEPGTTRAGYTFDGWFTNSDLTESRVTFPYTVTADITLYAKWTLITYTVDFVTNDGTAVTQMDNITSIDTEPGTSREGYTFDGWFTDSRLTGSRVAFPYTLTADITLYAKWTSIIASFVTNGGTAVTRMSNITSIETEPGTSRAGYDFDGWFTNSDLTGNRVTFPYTVTTSITLYAKWRFNSSFSVGSIGPGGGTIFSVSQTGFTIEGYNGTSGSFATYTAHYLEAAPENAGSAPWGASWSSSGSVITIYQINDVTTFSSSDSDDTRANTIGKGRKDTQLIVNYLEARSSTGSAAQLCAGYSRNGLNDWFLPSIGELSRLYQSGVSGITSGTYWSSSQHSNYTNSWTLVFSNGSQRSYSRSSTYYVRPIRAF